MLSIPVKNNYVKIRNIVKKLNKIENIEHMIDTIACKSSIGGKYQEVPPY